MPDLSIRGLDDETARRLKETARKKQVSVNRYALDLLRQGLGLARSHPRHEPYHDLDALAGTWTEEQAREFLSSIKAFEEVDEELWW